MDIQRYIYQAIKAYASCIGKFLKAFEKYDFNRL